MGCVCVYLCVRIVLFLQQRVIEHQVDQSMLPPPFIMMRNRPGEGKLLDHGHHYLELELKSPDIVEIRHRLHCQFLANSR